MAAGLVCQQLGMILPPLVKPQWRGRNRGALWEIGSVQLEWRSSLLLTKTLQFNRMSELGGTFYINH